MTGKECWNHCEKAPEFDKTGSGLCNYCNGFCCRKDGFGSNCSQTLKDAIDDRSDAHYCVSSVITGNVDISLILQCKF